MSVVASNELTSPRSGSRKGSYNEVKIWKVEVDDPTDGARVARLATDALPDPVPVRGDTHPDNARIFVDTVSAEPMGDSRLWYLVTAEYKTRERDGGGGGGGERDDNPLNDKVRVRWSSWSETAVLEWTTAHPREAILNSAKVPFDPPLEQEDFYPQVQIVRNEPYYNPSKADGYRNSVNSGSGTIAGLPVVARQAHLIEFSGDNAERLGIDYYVVTYTIQFKITDRSGQATNWDREVLDQGYYYLDGTIWRKCTVEGEETGRIRRLDGSGGVLDDDAPASAAVFGSFPSYKQRNFDDLNLRIEI